MKISKIYYSSRFIKAFKKLPKDKQKLAISREKIFRQDPFAVSLKTHKLSNNLDGYWSFSITHQDRVMFKFLENNEVIFYKIGDHDIYKK